MSRQVIFATIIAAELAPVTPQGLRYGECGWEIGTLAT